jgi:dihydropteroate synthase
LSGEFIAGKYRFPLDRVWLMGILNVTEDSFSGDGLLSCDAVLEKARELHAEGADILDVGGETARTNRPAISDEEEIARIVPVIERLRGEFPGTPVSLNTWRPRVADAGLRAGAAILNDMSGLSDADNARIAARHKAGLLIMHLRGRPKEDHTHVGYADVLEELLGFFREKIAIAEAHGLQKANLLLDPGLDFAKQRQDNLKVLRGLAGLVALGCPVLLANSRKTFIGQITGRPPADRDWGTLASSFWAVLQGVRFLRVHNVAIHRDALKVWEALKVSRNLKQTQLQET